MCSLTRRVVTSLKRQTNSFSSSPITQEVGTLLMRRAFDTTLPRASISRTRSGLRRLSSPTSRSHRPYAAGLALYSATSPYPDPNPQPVGSIGNPPFPSQRGLPPDIFGGARWEVYCRSIHPGAGFCQLSVSQSVSSNSQSAWKMPVSK